MTNSLHPKSAQCLRWTQAKASLHEKRAVNLNDQFTVHLEFNFVDNNLFRQFQSATEVVCQTIFFVGQRCDVIGKRLKMVRCIFHGDTDTSVSDHFIVVMFITKRDNVISANTIVMRQSFNTNGFLNALSTDFQNAVWTAPWTDIDLVTEFIFDVA